MLSFASRSLMPVFILLAAMVLPTLATGQGAGDESVANAGTGSLASPRAAMSSFLSAMNDIKRGDPKRMVV